MSKNEIAPYPCVKVSFKSSAYMTLHLTDGNALLKHWREWTKLNSPFSLELYNTIGITGHYHVFLLSTIESIDTYTEESVRAQVEYDRIEQEFRNSLEPNEWEG